MAGTLADVNIRIGARIEGLQKGLRQAERELQRSGQVMSNLGSSITSSISLPLAAAGFASVKFASELQTSFTKIENLVGVTGPALEELKTAVAEVSKATGIAQVDVSKAALFITGAGLRGQQALEALEASAKASAVGLGDQASIAKVAGAAVAAYGEANITSSQAVDKLLAIVREGNAEASELAPVLGSVLPIASQLGVSFDEVGANIATFTRLGVGASTAVDGLRSLLGNILKPSEQATKELAKVGLSMDTVRKSISERGLAQTLVELQSKFSGNSEALARIFGDIQGLTNALATAGAQGEDYVKIVDSIANSQGGLDAAFQKTTETAGFKFQKSLVDLQNAGIQLGATLLPAITGILQAVTPMLEAFASLPDPVKNTTVAFGLAAVAAGPVISTYGNLRTVVGTLSNSFEKSLKPALRIAADTFSSTREAIAAAGGSVTRLTGVLPAAAAAWKGFDLVTRATIIGAIAAGVLALGLAVHSLTSELSTAEQAQKAVNDVQLTAQKNIAAERLEAERLTGILASNTASYDDKKAALDQLNQISPQYFHGLNLEKSTVEEITKAYDGYVANLLKAAKAQAAQARIVEIEKDRLGVLQEIADVQAGKSFAAGIGGSSDGAARIIAGLTEKLEGLESRQKSLAKTFLDTAPQIQKSVAQIAAPAGASPILGAKATSTGGSKSPARITAPDLLPTKGDIESSAQNVADILQASLQKSIPQVAAALNIPTDPLTALGDALAIVDNKAAVFGSTFDASGEKIKLVESALTSLLESGVNPYGTQVTALVELLAQMNANLDANAVRAQEFSAALQTIVESGIEETLGNTAAAFGAVFAGAASGSAIFSTILDGLLSVLEQVGKTAIATGIAIAGIKKALQTLNPAAAIIGGIALIALTKFVRSKLADSTPKFAHGGLVYGPTFALTGEYPGAQNNPEVIAPLDKLRDILGDSGGGRVEVFGRLEGNDILLSSERAGNRRERVRGR